MLAPDEDGAGTASSYDSYLDDHTYAGIFGFLLPSNCMPYAISGYSDDAMARSCKVRYPSNPSAKYASGTTVANGPGYPRTGKPPLQLTNNVATMKAPITSPAPSGSTDIFEGVIWGWRTLSPTSAFGDGAPYAGPTKKVTVVMTDGTNTGNTNDGPNWSDYSSLGYILDADGSSPNSRPPPGNQNLTDSSSTRAALDTLTRTACTNAKAAGVAIYTVAFSTPGDAIDTTGVNMLAACASGDTVRPSGSKAFVANDATALKPAFTAIATGIGKVRPSQ